MDSRNYMPILVPVEFEKFMELIRNMVREELKAVLPLITGPMVQKDEPLLTRKEMAAYLRISLVTLGDWVKRGLPSHAKRGRVLFVKSEVMKWLKETRLNE